MQWRCINLALYYSPQSLILLSCITVGSVEPMWPVSKDVELREDVQVLIKFWQAMLSDKKYMKYFMVAAPVDTSQLLTHGSSTGSQPHSQHLVPLPSWQKRPGSV